MLWTTSFTVERSIFNKSNIYFQILVLLQNQEICPCEHNLKRSDLSYLTDDSKPELHRMKKKPSILRII